MYKYILLILLTSCASTDRITQIESDYRAFASECSYMGGKLSIDLPFNKRRVQNAPVTVWEMRDAVCSYPDAYPMTMRMN